MDGLASITSLCYLHDRCEQPSPIYLAAQGRADFPPAAGLWADSLTQSLFDFVALRPNAAGAMSWSQRHKHSHRFHSNPWREPGDEMAGLSGSSRLPTIAGRQVGP